MTTMPEPKRLLKLIAATVAGLVAVGAVGFFIQVTSDLCGDTAVAKVPAPDHSREVVIVERNCGATTGFNYAVHLVPKGGEPKGVNQVAWLHDAIRNRSAYGVNPKWRSSRELVLEYLEARDTGRLESGFAIAGTDVRLEFRPYQFDSTAAPGGMAYNLSRKPN